MRQTSGVCGDSGRWPGAGSLRELLAGGKGLLPPEPQMLPLPGALAPLESSTFRVWGSAGEDLPGAAGGP